MQYGLIGEKLGHSYSKFIHEALGEYSYELCPLERDQVENFIKAGNFKGLNVTIPYKQRVIPFCHKVSDLAKAIGAVNTLYFDEDGNLCGTNTDYMGFLYAMKAAGIEIAGRKALVLGDGATSGTIRKALADSGAGQLLVATRHPERYEAAALAASEAASAAVYISYEEIPEHRDCQLVVNTTPVGMWPNVDASPCDLGIFQDCQGAFDVIYNPCPTAFLQGAQAHGIPWASGLSMLVAQAACAAGYFTGRGPDHYLPRIPEISRLLSEQLKSAT